MRSGGVWYGSRGTDVLGRVGCGAAGNVQRIGRAITGTESWGLAVQAGKDEIRTGAVRSGSRGGDWNDARGLVRWGKAV